MGPGPLFPALRVRQPRVEPQRRCLFERARPPNTYLQAIRMGRRAAARSLRRVRGKNGDSGCRPPCASLRSHPRERGPCSTLRCALLGRIPINIMGPLLHASARYLFRHRLSGYRALNCSNAVCSNARS